MCFVLFFFYPLLSLQFSHQASTTHYFLMDCHPAASFLNSKIASQRNMSWNNEWCGEERRAAFLCFWLYWSNSWTYFQYRFSILEQCIYHTQNRNDSNLSLLLKTELFKMFLAQQFIIFIKWSSYCLCPVSVWTLIHKREPWMTS